MKMTSLHPDVVEKPQECLSLSYDEYDASYYFDLQSMWGLNYEYLYPKPELRWLKL